ncbi:GtrA family protein [Paenibacillus sp. VTT E-133291]|uniref:GtrA family protein n=1 Tax=unclassified Paenibacillus TaxID=185978 RepID=UPI0015C628B3
MKKTKLFESTYFRYAITGVFNTLHHYFWFYLLHSQLGYIYANLIAFIIANVVSFFLNTRFTFRTSVSIKKFTLYPFVLLTQMVVSFFVPFIFVHYVQVLKGLSPIFTTIINFPVGYLITKLVLDDRKKIKNARTQ